MNSPEFHDWPGSRPRSFSLANDSGTRTVKLRMSDRPLVWSFLMCSLRHELSCDLGAELRGIGERCCAARLDHLPGPPHVGLQTELATRDRRAGSDSALTIAFESAASTAFSAKIALALGSPVCTAAS
jgi:hypothetical protein